MFPINPASGRRPFPNRKLYIPLSFLLIGDIIGGYGDLYLLYIPLCFLLIGPAPTYMQDLTSLYIPLCFLLIPAPENAPIIDGKLYIPLCFLLIGDQFRIVMRQPTTLHSTMFPINRIYPILQRELYQSLHSTMFPINQRKRRGYQKRCVHFTFHYVSY